MIPLTREFINEWKLDHPGRTIKVKYYSNIFSTFNWSYFGLKSGKVLWYDWYIGVVVILNAGIGDTIETIKEELDNELSLDLTGFSVTKLSDTTSYSLNEFNRVSFIEVSENGYRFTLDRGSYRIDNNIYEEFLRFETIPCEFGGNYVCYDLKYRCGATKSYLSGVDRLISKILKNYEGSSRYIKKNGDLC